MIIIALYRNVIYDKRGTRLVDIVILTARSIKHVRM
jgi:hypothetical protein